MRIKVAAAFLAGAVVGAAGTFLIASAYFGNWPFEVDKGLPPSPRPIEWAERIDKPGLPNLHRVSAALLRGGQPTAGGMRELKAMGVKTIVNLRKFHSDRQEIGDTALAYEHIRTPPLGPQDEQVVRFLQIVTDESRTPAFVHCQYGADRTGMMCAVYRVVVEGWPNQEAIAEMTKGGFGFHRTWAGLIEYVRELDVAEIKRRAGLADR